jgi:excisionase family DNA binding protein
MSRETTTASRKGNDFGPDTRQLLRALGETALRLADGQPIDRQWLQGHLPSATPESARDPQRLLTVTEACALLRISRWSFYRLIQQNQLHSVTIGRRRLVPHTELNRFVTSLSGIGEAA